MGDDELVFVHDLEGVCLYASLAAADALGHVPEELLGTSMVSRVRRSDRSVLVDVAFDLASGARTSATARVHLRHRDGHVIAFDTTTFAVRDADGRLCGLRTVAVPAGAPHRRRVRLVARTGGHEALYDTATGAASPALLADRLEQAAGRHRRSGEPFAVLSVVLADDVEELTAIATRRLRRVVRRTDTVARTGPTELTVLCAGANPAAAVAVARRAAASLGAPVSVAARRRLTVTVGVAPAEGWMADPSALLRRARRAASDPARRGEGPVRLAT